MPTNKKIRLATLNDSDSILNIYAPFIADTVITFEYKVPTKEEFRERMAAIQKKYPWLVCEIDDAVVGYAYASTFNEREAYQWSVDYSIYIRPEYHRKHIGKALYFALTGALKLQGFCNAYSLITAPNVSSESLHQSCEFKEIGICHNVGYKLGGWHDVKYYELKLQDPSPSPAYPKPIGEITDTDEFRAILEKAEQMIK